MKLLVVAGVLVGFLSAATHLTEEELLKQKQASSAAAATVESFESVGAGEPVHPIHEILGKLTAGLGQAVAQNENLDPNNPLKSLMDMDYMKSHGGIGILTELNSKLKDALGDTESFKNFLGGADANGDEDPLNIGKMFPQKVLDDILKGKTAGYNEDAHGAVDHELSKIFGIEKEKMTEMRTRIFNKFSEAAKDGNLNVEDLFDEDFKRSLFREL